MILGDVIDVVRDRSAHMLARVVPEDFEQLDDSAWDSHEPPQA
ncbi:MAG: hypothetical protein ACJAR2_001296 [Ilumatobacter sp.]|jgi:hypothetical protein